MGTVVCDPPPGTHHTMIRQKKTPASVSGSEHRQFLSRRYSKIISDADSVTCSGVALTMPEVNKMNKVLVDCSRAGADALFAAVLGPEGQEQVHVKHKEGNKYLVEFRMTERGKHILYIKWGSRTFLAPP